MLRRSFFAMPALAALPVRAWAESVQAVRSLVPTVRAGEDGLSSTTYKVLTSDTAGDLFVMEQLNRRKGGPSRHIHHHEDELFFCLEGQYVVEVGDNRSVLNPGDCVLGPRGIAHAWAFSGEATGRMLISFAPAGKMEAFFARRETSGIKPGEYASTKADAALLREYGMELVGPPIPLKTLLSVAVRGVTG